MTTIPSVSLPLFALLLAGAVAAQSHSVGPYDAESFEAPRLLLGTLPGTGYADGQDGWMLLDSLAYPGNLAAAQVQTSVVRSGAQAVRWNAAQMTPGSNGELRRNAMFSLTTGVIEFEFDFQLASASNPSQAWGFYTQPYPHPQSAQLWWEIRPNGELWYCTTSNRNWFATGSFVSRDVWHHARTVVDIFGNRTALYLDGTLAAQGQPVGVNFNAPDHGFAQFWCNGAGNDALYLDNFTVRERIAPLGLSKDLPRLRVGQRSVLEFHLAGHAGIGNHAYALLGSLSGSSPGISLGSATLPLVHDAFLGILAGALGSPALPGFLGTLPQDGDAFARFDTQVPLPASLVGTTVTFAWFTYHPTVAVSEAVRVPITL